MRSPSAHNILAEQKRLREQRRASDASDSSVASDISSLRAPSSGAPSVQRRSWQSDLSGDSAVVTTTAAASATVISSSSSSPKNKREMAQWYDYALTQTALDLFMQLNVFGGRFDMRTLRRLIVASVMGHDPKLGKNAV